MATQRYLSAPPKELVDDLSSSGSSVQVADIKGWDGNDLDTSDVSADYIPATLINDKQTKVEFLLLTASTVGNGATTGMTIFKRGLSHTATGVQATDQTEVTANKLDWIAGETKLLIGTHAPYLLGTFVNKYNTEQIEAVHTYLSTAIPKLDSYIAPTADEEFATKKFVEDTSNGTPVSLNRITPVAIAGEVLVAGNFVYLDPTDGEWKKTDASAGATSDNVLLGIAQGAGTDGGQITGGVLLWGFDSNQTGMTEGDPMFLSDTAGEIADSAGTQEVEVGQAYSATELYFCPRYASTPTGDEKDAMAGNSGVPSADNLFITELGLQRSTETYAVDAAGSDTYVVTLDPVPAGYVAGMTLKVKFGTANTGACTINVNSLGAKDITKSGAQALITGDILANQVCVLVYDGTQFEIQNVSSKDLKDGSNADHLHIHAYNERLATMTTPVTVSNTTETDIISVSVPANTLGTANLIHGVFIISNLQTNSAGADALAIRLKYGATTVITRTFTFGSSESGLGGKLEFWLFADGGTSAQEASMIIDCKAASSGGDLTSFLFSEDQGTATEDSTGALDLDISVQWTDNQAGGDSISVANGFMEIIRT